MYDAFRRSDYYGPSVPPWSRQPTADLPATTTLAGRRHGQLQDGSHVHDVAIDGTGAQLFPLQPRHGYAAGLPHGLTTGCIRPASESPATDLAAGVHCCPALIGQVRAGVTLEGVQPLVHSRYASPSCSADPGPSGSTGPSRLCQGCSHPHPRFRDQAALSFTGLLRQPSRGVLAPPLANVAPRGAPCRGDARGDVTLHNRSLQLE